MRFSRHWPGAIETMLDRRQFLLAMALLGSAGCSDRRRRFDYQWLTFATTLKLSLWHRRAQRADAACAALKQRFDQLHRDWYAWGDGELGAINQRLARGETAPVSRTLMALLARAETLAADSAGLFDPAAGQLSQLWQFDRFDRRDTHFRPPPADALQAALRVRAAGYTLDTDGGRLRPAAPGLQIDLGGIAKGAALADGLALLADHGMRRALIDAGGDVATLGDADDAPFRIGLAMPRAALHVAAGEAVMSSGDYARFWEYQGQRYQHVLDPRTGRPARGGTASTVIHRDPLRADATATALLVAGFEQFWPVCDAMQIEMALLVDNAGKMLATPAMRQRMSAL